jgi:hypothetical protein
MPLVNVDVGRAACREGGLCSSASMVAIVSVAGYMVSRVRLDGLFLGELFAEPGGERVPVLITVLSRVLVEPTRGFISGDLGGGVVCRSRAIL